MPTEFLDSKPEIVNDDFQEWRVRHSDGYVVNMTSATKATLHRAMCGHFEGTERRLADELDWLLTSARKVCSVDVEALRRWAKESAPPFALKDCGCLRKP